MESLLKILVTGKNRRIAKDVCDHCREDRDYLTVMCPPDRAVIFDIIHAEMPNVVIICTSNETIDEIRDYNILSGAIGMGTMSVFVIANEEDQQRFQNFSSLQKLYFLSRPVSLFSLYEKLIIVADDLKDIKEDKSAFMGEFNNPNVGIERKRILVVDDDTEQLMHIKDLLEEFYDVSVVKSGEAALKYLSKKNADLILLDYVMPEMDGPTVLDALRQDSYMRTIPVVFLTGITEKAVVVETITILKPQGYIVKPAKKSELVAKIIDVLG